MKNILAILQLFSCNLQQMQFIILPAINQKRRERGLQCIKNQDRVKGTETPSYETQNDMKPGSFLISHRFTAEILLLSRFKTFCIKTFVQQ